MGMREFFEAAARQASGAYAGLRPVPADVAANDLPTVSVAQVTPKPERTEPPAVPLHIRAGLGILQRIAEILENQYGLPADDPYIIDATANLAADTLGIPVAAASRLRGLHISVIGGAAAGLTTVSLYYPGAPQSAPGSGQNGRMIYKAEMGSADRVIAADFNVRIPAGARLAIKTSVTTPTELICVALITREKETAVNWFQGHRGV